MRCQPPWNSIPARDRRWSALAVSEAGFTMIELLISALMVALIAAAVAQGLIGGIHMTADQRHRSQAVEIAQQDEERIGGLSSDQLYGLSQTVTVSLDGLAFTVTSTAQLLNTSGTAICSTTGAVAYFRTSSDVTWPTNRRTHVKDESVITPPAGGALLTQMKDQTGAPLGGVTVTATGPDFSSAVTDSNGCTMFGGLATGQYTVTASDTGYVDPTGDTTPSATLPVSGTGTTTPTMNPIGLAGSIAATFAGSINGTSSLTGEADSLSYIGTGASYSMATPASVTVASPATQIPTPQLLFPFALAGPSYSGNYEVWAGKCPQMQPPVLYRSVASVSPGTSAPATVKEPVLNVQVTSGGLRVQPAHVRITFQSTNGTPCSYTWSSLPDQNAATNPTGALANPGQPFATTLTTGTGASASKGTGTLSVCADLNSKWFTASSITDSFTASTLVTVPIANSSGTCQ